MAIRDGEPNRKPVDEPPAATPAPVVKPAFAIRVRQLYYTDTTPFCWTQDVTIANIWPDRALPDGIIAYWNKVHYVKDIKGSQQRSALCGQEVLNIAEVVEITAGKKSR